MTVSSLLHYRARDVSVSAKVANAFRRRRFKLRDECGCTSSIKIRSSARCEKEGAPTGEERRGGEREARSLTDREIVIGLRGRVAEFVVGYYALARGFVLLKISIT